MPTGPRLLPLGAMSARLGIAPKNLRLAAIAGTVPSIAVGKDGLLFEPEAVEAALLKRARRAQPESPEGEQEVSDGR